MNPAFRALAFATITLSTVLAADRALPCSLAESPEPGFLTAEGTTTGPLPLFLSQVASQPQLIRVDDPTATPIALETVEELSGMFVRFELTRVWRPAAALTSGQYRAVGVLDTASMSEVTFFVDDTLIATPPTLSDITLAVTIDEPEEGGCGSFSSCDGVDFTRLDLTLPVDTSTDIFRLEINNPKTGLRRVELIRTPDFSGNSTITVFDNDNRFPGSFKRDRLCLTLTPIAEEGFIGAPFDVGCFDPDGDDPRVTDERGCSTGQSGHGSMLIWLVALLLAHRATRRAPAT